jgi:hypothetical protein
MKMYAKTYAKMDILISDELNQCMACDYTSYEYGEVYDKKGDEITSWNTEDHVVCPKSKGERRCNPKYNYAVVRRLHLLD